MPIKPKKVKQKTKALDAVQALAQLARRMKIPAVTSAIAAIMGTKNKIGADA